MTKEELLKFILENKMAYHRMLKVTSPQLYQEVSTKYSGVKNIGESFWLYCNDYEDTRKCKCGAKLLFENVVNGYKSTECKSCYNLTRKLNSTADITIKNQKNQSLPICENTNCNNIVTSNKSGIWSKYCSKSCRGQYNSLKSRLKSKATMKKNYGVEHALQSPIILNKMQDDYERMHGVRNPMSNPDAIQNYKTAMQSKFGFTSTFQDKERYQSQVDKCAISYGYPADTFTNISQIPEVHNKKMKSGMTAKDYILPSGRIIRIQGWENKFLDLALKYYDEQIFEFDQKPGIPYIIASKDRHYHPDFILPNTMQIIEVKSDYTFYNDLETNVAKAYGSMAAGYEITFAIYRENGSASYLTYSDQRNFIKSKLDTYVTYKELVQFDNYIIDFLIDNANIAITYRSIDFTNDTFIDKQYYSAMHQYFDTIGIQLIVVNNNNVNDVWVKSLLSKFIKNKDVIYARNTTVKPIGKNEIISFLNNNHIQGNAQTTVKYGLYNNNILVAVMCFNKFRNGTGKNRGENAFELVRYATSSTVIGGASKLLSHFIKTHSPDLIYSYSDNTISDGNLYKTLNFDLESNVLADYSYNIFGNDLLLSRFSNRKGALDGKYSFYDSSMSEHQIMSINGFRRVYDAGKKTWILDLK